MEGAFYDYYFTWGICDTSELYDMYYCERDVDCLRRIISKYVTTKHNIDRIYYVEDKDLEDKFRDLLWGHKVVQIRSICKRMKVRKVSKIKKKHDLIEAMISWIMKHNCRECELRSISRNNLTRLAYHFNIYLEGCINGDDIIDKVLKVVDKDKADWRWILDFDSDSE